MDFQYEDPFIGNHYYNFIYKQTKTPSPTLRGRISRDNPSVSTPGT